MWRIVVKLQLVMENSFIYLFYFFWQVLKALLSVCVMIQSCQCCVVETDWISSMCPGLLSCSVGLDYLLWKGGREAHVFSTDTLKLEVRIGLSFCQRHRFSLPLSILLVAWRLKTVPRSRVTTSRLPLSVSRAGSANCSWGWRAFVCHLRPVCASTSVGHKIQQRLEPGECDSSCFKKKSFCFVYVAICGNKLLRIHRRFTIKLHN